MTNFRPLFLVVIINAISINFHPTFAGGIPQKSVTLSSLQGHSPSAGPLGNCPRGPPNHHNHDGGDKHYPSSRPSSYPSSSIIAFPAGIQYSVLLSDLNANCSICIDTPYSNSTTFAEIAACAGPYLFVGARKSQDSTFLLGAYDSTDNILQETELNTPHLSNGVYWYFSPGYSFGFLGNADLHQNAADIGGTLPYSRLSWHIDQNIGGFRAGLHTYLDNDHSWQKSIYNCQGAFHFVQFYLHV